MPLIAGISYPITGNISGPVVINDNQSAPAVLFSYAWASAMNSQVTYSIDRGSSHETGRLLISTDGTNISFTRDGEDVTDTGVTLSASLSGANVELMYTSTSTGTAGQFFYTKILLQ